MSDTDAEDAHRALNEIAERRRQVAAAAATPLPWRYLLGIAAGLWVMGIGQDFDSHAVMVIAAIIGAMILGATGAALRQSRRVQPRTPSREGWLILAGVAVVMLAVYFVAIGTAHLTHAPFPHTIAGAAEAAAFVVISVCAQRIARNRLRADH